MVGHVASHSQRRGATSAARRSARTRPVDANRLERERRRHRQKAARLFGRGVPSREGKACARFIDALLLDEARGAAVLAELADRKPAFVAVHLSDVWKAAAAWPDLLSIAYRDFPGGGDMHGVMKAAREWMQENLIEGGFAVEPRGAAIRLHYLPRKTDAERLLARLLPFSGLQSARP